MQASIVLSLLGLAIAAPTALVERAACASGVHIIVARASTESPGEGIIGQVASMIKQRIPGSDDVAVSYPATLDNYESSEAKGVAAMTQLVESYARSCPNSKIVLLGYSQGAQVTFDTLCGSSESGFTQTSPLPSQYQKNILAAIAMGDPSHVPGQAYDVGTSKHSGYFPRQTLTACSPYAAKIQSYCDANDTFCDSGNSIQVHQSYVQKYGSAATAFVVNRYSASQ